MSSAARLSLGANVALAGIIVILLWRGRPAAPAASDPAVRPAASRSETPRAPVTEFRRKSPGVVLDPAAVAQLEQLGISRDTLINVVLEDLNRRSTRRLLELQKRFAPKLVPDREMRRFVRDSDADRDRELKAAFGEDGYRAWDKEQTLRELNRARAPGDELPMTAAEAEQAYRLQKEYDDRYRELQAAMEDGDADHADAGLLLAQAQQALDRKLGQLLGEARFDALRGNTDPTTEVYRQYGDLNPTPDQAKAVVQAEGDYRAREAALTEQLKADPAAAANVTAELKALSDAQDEYLRRIFGAEAYDNMKRQNDPTYRTLQQYADVWQLKGPEIQSVYDTIHAFQDQTNRLRVAAAMSEAAGQPVDWRQVNAAIEQARQQTEAGLQNLVGGDRLSRLEQNGVLTIH